MAEAQDLASAGQYLHQLLGVSETHKRVAVKRVMMKSDDPNPASIFNQQLQ